MPPVLFLFGENPRIMTSMMSWLKLSSALFNVNLRRVKVKNLLTQKYKTILRHYKHFLIVMRVFIILKPFNGTFVILAPFKIQIIFGIIEIDRY